VPSNRKLRSDDVDGFMLAFWDAWRDLEAEFDCELELRVIPLEQRGHTRFQVLSKCEGATGVWETLCGAELPWPTAQAAQVHTLLYSLLMRLWKELRDQRARWHAQNSTPLD